MSARAQDRLGDVAPSAGFACSWRTEGAGTAWMRVSGELDIATTPRFEEALGEARAQARVVVIDLRELSFIDSYGVYAIVSASAAAARAGSRLVLLRGRPAIDRVFTLAGLRDAVEICDIGPAEPPVQVLLALAEKEGDR